MDRKEKYSLALFIVSIMLGAVLYDTYLGALAKDDLLAVCIITVTNICVFLIASVATYRLLKS